MTDGPENYRPRRALPPDSDDDFLDDDLDVTRRREDFDPSALSDWRPRRSRFASDPDPEPSPDQSPLPADNQPPADDPLPGQAAEQTQSGPPTFEQPAVPDPYAPDPYAPDPYTQGAYPQDSYPQGTEQQPSADGVAAGLNDDYVQPEAPYADPSAPFDETRPARSSTIFSPDEHASEHARTADRDHLPEQGEPDDQTHVANPAGPAAAAVPPLQIPGAQSLQPGPLPEAPGGHDADFRTYSTPVTPSEGGVPSGPYRPRRSLDPDPPGWGSSDDGDRKLAKLPVIAIAAAVLAIIVGVVFTVVQVRDNDTAVDPAGEPGEPSAPQSAQPVGPLNEQSMLNETRASGLDGERTWQIASTENGRTEDSPLPLCVSAPAEGQPIPEATIIRTLTASGGQNVAALHQADAYPSTDEAAQAYTLVAGALGGCTVDNAYLASSATGSDLGNQASGVVVQIGAGEAEFHTVVVSRTGSVVNVIDVTRTGKEPASMEEAGKALASVTNAQCTRVAGVCATGSSLKSAPPPVGGDQPGYLNSTDFPIIAKASGTWEGTEPTNKVDPATSSQCEGVKFSSAKGLSSEGQRTYLMRDEPSVAATFGIDEIVLTMKDAKAAKALADQVGKNIKGCEKKQLTAKVSKSKGFKGTGAKSAAITGTAHTISFDLGKSTVTYRVGISSVGNKVVYTFLPIDKNFDFSDDQWADLNVRAGIRASQTK